MTGSNEGLTTVSADYERPARSSLGESTMEVLDTFDNSNINTEG